ncbi:unnamed protein product [Schistosoma bovis]|nr:unnamed protein product [Schistosoma bovis]
MSSEVIPANTSVNNRNREVFNDDIGDGDCIHEKSIHDSICVLTLNDEDITMNNNDNTNETASNKLSINNNIKDNKSFKHSKSSIYHIDNNIQNKLTKNLTGKVISNTNCDKSITDTNSCYLTSTVQLHSDESTYSDDHIPLCSNRSNKQLLQTTGTMNNNAMICKHTGKEKHFVIKEQEISTILDKPNGISCISNVNPNVLSVFRGYPENNSIITTASPVASTKSETLTDLKINNEISTTYSQPSSDNDNAHDMYSCNYPNDASIYHRNASGYIDDIVTSDIHKINSSCNGNSSLKQQNLDNFFKTNMKSQVSCSTTTIAVSINTSPISSSSFSVNQSNSLESNQHQRQKQIHHDHRTLVSSLCPSDSPYLLSQCSSKFAKKRPVITTTTTTTATTTTTTTNNNNNNNNSTVHDHKVNGNDINHHLHSPTSISNNPKTHCLTTTKKNTNSHNDNNNYEHSTNNSYDINITVNNSNDNNNNNNDNYIDETNLIINYLPPYMSKEEVKVLFSTCGKVESCKLIRDKTSGESLGYAFVKYSQSNEAQQAINTLNGLSLQNKTIKVSLARPNCESIKGANLYICGLPKTMTQKELEHLFSQYGRIITARILYDNKTGISRGVAFIRFDHRYEAELAIQQLNGHQLPSEYSNDMLNRPITVKFANSPSSIKFDNLSLVLLKQAAQLQAITTSTAMPSPLSRNATSAVIAAGLLNPLQQRIAAISNRLKYSITSPSSTETDLLSTIAMSNSILAPTIVASTGGLTSNGWCIFVYNLAPEVEESNLWQLFGPFGAVQSIKIVYDTTNNKCKGFAFVTMSNYEEAVLAIHSLNGFVLDNRILQVSFKITNSKSRSFALSALSSSSLSSLSTQSNSIPFDTSINSSNIQQTLSNQQDHFNSEKIISTKNSLIIDTPMTNNYEKQQTQLQQHTSQLYHQNNLQNNRKTFSTELTDHNSIKSIITNTLDKSISPKNSSIQLVTNSFNKASSIKSKYIKTVLNDKTQTELFDPFIIEQLPLKSKHIDLVNNSKKQTNKSRNSQKKKEHGDSKKNNKLNNNLQ